MMRRKPQEAVAVEIVIGCCAFCPSGRTSDGLRYTLPDGRLVTSAELGRAPCEIVEFPKARIVRLRLVATEART